MPQFSLKIGPFLLLGNFATNECVSSVAQNFVTGEILISEVVTRFYIPQGMCMPPQLVSSLCLVSVGSADPERGSEPSSETVNFSQGVQRDFPAEFPTHGSKRVAFQENARRT